MINEHKVKCFLSLAETLSFTETGRRLYISQQAVSRHIADLEEALGFRLFERSRNSVEMTEIGVRFYRFFRETGERFAALRAEISRETADRARNIRIGYQNWLDFGPALGTAMAALRKCAPETHLLGERHSPVALITLLESGKLDMILIHERFIPRDPNLKRLLLIRTPMQVVVAKSDPLCRDYAGDYRVFHHHALLIDSFEGETASATVKRAKAELKPYGFLPEEIVALPNRDSIYIEAEFGRGIFLSSAMAQNAQSGALARFDTDVFEGLFCVWRAGVLDDHIEQYARLLKNEYKKLRDHFIRTHRWP